MKQILLLIQLIISANVLCQISFENRNNYYDGNYFKDNEFCFAYNFDSKLIENDNYQIVDGHLKLRVLRTAKNMLEISFDEYGLHVPFDRESMNNYWFHLLETLNEDELKEFFSYSDNILTENIDTLFVIRNNLESNSRWVEKTDGHGKLYYCKIESPNEIIKFLVVKNTEIDSLKYTNSTVELDIEIRDKNIVTLDSKNRILCPQEIDMNLIKKLNESLIDFKYLPEGNRHDYLPEIKRALGEFQIDFSLMKGFVDQNTLNALGIEH